jgi:hypothetical protein
MQVASATIPDLHDLSLDLPKPCRQSTPSRALRNQNAGRPYHWIDDITRPQCELLDPPSTPAANKGLVQIVLRFGQRPPLRLPSPRQQRHSVAWWRIAWKRRSVERALTALRRRLKLFDVSVRNNAGGSPLQFAFDVEFRPRLLQRGPFAS